LRAEFNENLLRLAEAIDRLPDDQRQALTLHHLHGWTLDAIGAHMGRSQTAVAGLIKRGLRQLRENLAPP
jgi:RNA polymerase sigma-70 factor (ECF subfamily)